MQKRLTKKPILAIFFITIISTLASYLITSFLLNIVSFSYSISQSTYDLILQIAVINPLIIAPLASYKLVTLTNNLYIANEKLDYTNRFDSLTAVYNRKYTLSLAHKYLEEAKAKDKPFCVFLLDYDYFKKINDTFGHEVGDKVLIELCQTIKENIRKDDIFGRYGGEEFLLISPNTDEQEALVLASKIRQGVNKKVKIKEIELLMSISIGFSSLDNKNLSLEKLIANADKALYKAKALGRNKAISFRELNN